MSIQTAAACLRLLLSLHAASQPPSPHVARFMNINSVVTDACWSSVSGDLLPLPQTFHVCAWKGTKVCFHTQGWKGREVPEQIHTSNFTKVCKTTYMVLTELRFLKLWYQETVTVLFSNKKGYINCLLNKFMAEWEKSKILNCSLSLRRVKVEVNPRLKDSTKLISCRQSTLRQGTTTEELSDLQR